MYELYGPPFKVDKKNPQCLRDGSGELVRLMGASRDILNELATDNRWRNTTIAYVSRTDCPEWARACLRLFKIAPDISMDDLALEKEIYPGCKRTHFQRIYERTNIAYEDMLFFDNEVWNIEDVAPMGVCSVYTPRGMTVEVWDAGLKAFAKAAEARKRGETPELEIIGRKRR